MSHTSDISTKSNLTDTANEGKTLTETKDYVADKGDDKGGKEKSTAQQMESFQKNKIATDPAKDPAAGVQTKHKDFAGAEKMQG